ncbi:hypothetical protein EVAR_81632_1 [Eumeta japonica]|uniref:Uncharacterized protein n=1 Tax=Eumeta variegata TaxID=151549 RepID=A0A4C1WDA1_EUMVA|nr:hypothetical protein EVAR_81632_1 [Eumeta japonica]
MTAETGPDPAGRRRTAAALFQEIVMRRFHRDENARRAGRDPRPSPVMVIPRVVAAVDKAKRGCGGGTGVLQAQAHEACFNLTVEKTA